MKRELTLVSSMLVVVAIVALCIGGCGKKAAETGGEPPSPMGETTGPAPAGEQPSGEAPAAEELRNEDDPAGRAGRGAGQHALQDG